MLSPRIKGWLGCFAFVLVSAASAANAAQCQSSASVTQYQVRSWLAANDKLFEIESSIPSALGDPIRLAWDYKTRPLCAELLYSFLQSKLRFNDAQMSQALQGMKDLPE
jgi:hypothetical protein